MPSDHLASKIAEAHQIVNQALDEHLGGKRLVATAVLFSGGNDSTTLAHLFQTRATHAIHCNTTIGVEATRQFVRDRCAEWDLPLLEEIAPIDYHDLVVEQGFPGPAHHFKMYQRLKERGLRQAKKKLVRFPREERVLFLAGRRRSESARRAGVPENEREGSAIWASPFANWTKDDLNEYRETFDVPRNTMADTLGMSGECLCGAFAEPGEYDRILAAAPEVAEQILQIEEDAIAAGIPEPRCRWGWGAYRGDPNGTPPKSGPMCSSCDDRFELRRMTPDERSPQLQAIMDARRERNGRS
jgi:3'-phosphoadenosine 5'-phosphosulfate sulfotransferase (PAPS reductase)/FAD synthetase